MLIDVGDMYEGIHVGDMYEGIHVGDTYEGMYEDIRLACQGLCLQDW